MDGKSVRNKLVGNEQERAVSPVIGVILMVAITVILAAVIAAFVLDMGQGQSQSAQAGLDFSQDSDGITVTLMSDDRTDNGVTVECPNTGSTQSITSVGNTVTCDDSGNGLSDGDTVTVTATYDGSETVIGTDEYSA
ncbi:type IV pilin [Natrinema versiforme]|uniref:Type IV pilin n=1 Tax=Natrinema versiforme TaxID=88724 RepID=A0A4P8WLR4_9EURY|nr:type IV pilin N-terminal domain-containing protein [Natrinema versiforme]QCS44305.1 type IV pilin [Natrinema versiforme]